MNPNDAYYWTCSVLTAVFLHGLSRLWQGHIMSNGNPNLHQVLSSSCSQLALSVSISDNQCQTTCQCTSWTLKLWRVYTRRPSITLQEQNKTYVFWVVLLWFCCYLCKRAFAILISLTHDKLLDVTMLHTAGVGINTVNSVWPSNSDDFCGPTLPSPIRVTSRVPHIPNIPFLSPVHATPHFAQLKTTTQGTGLRALWYSFDSANSFRGIWLPLTAKAWPVVVTLRAQGGREGGGGGRWVRHALFPTSSSSVKASFDNNPRPHCY